MVSAADQHADTVTSLTLSLARSSNSARSPDDTGSRVPSSLKHPHVGRTAARRDPLHQLDQFVPLPPQVQRLPALRQAEQPEHPQPAPDKRFRGATHGRVRNHCGACHPGSTSVYPSGTVVYPGCVVVPKRLHDQRDIPQRQRRPVHISQLKRPAQQRLRLVRNFLAPHPRRKARTPLHSNARSPHSWATGTPRLTKSPPALLAVASRGGGNRSLARRWI